MTKDNIQTLKGFRDFLPEEAAARQKVLGKIRNVFERYGFLPMETPALEYKEVLTGKYGEEGDQLMYKFVDNGGREVAMRYDLTVPLARVVAQYQNELPMPLKRYQIAPVWRADRPQKGRFREFIQCDVDTVGSSSILADAEIISCINQALLELGLVDVIIRVNNRKVLDGLVKSAGIPGEKTVSAIRVLDKLEKIGEDGVRGELAAIGIQTKQADGLLQQVKQGLEDPQDIAKKLSDVEGAGELAELVEYLLDMGVKNYEIDLTLARGMDYYTGTIFEFVLPDARQFGSVAGGGRYDNLIGMFAGKEIPAVGCSIGIDRLLQALQELELIKYDDIFDVLVCNLDENLTEKYLKVVQGLRNSGIKTDFYYESAKLDKQLKYADKKNINFAVIIGTDEDKSGEATVKNMKTGEQGRARQDKLSDFLKQK
ncbi:histidine--tRNA ligase [bacterium]|nr:MAG: histidine--tRNA ligase [bacterium]